ncbi:MAG: PHP domain-containing protein [Candidatus Altiarchaeota archaeon]
MLFELHCHSRYSDGNGSPKQIVEYGRRIGLSGIAITDHDAIEGSLEAISYATDDFAVIPGFEVTAKEGHILGLNVRELVPRDLPAKETVGRIHALGGLAIAAHPYDRRRAGVGDLVLRLPFDAVEVLNGHTFANWKDPVKVCKNAGLRMVGGSDAHTTDEIGSVALEYEGDVLGAILAGKTGIRSKSRLQLFLRQGIGMVKRRL